MFRMSRYEFIQFQIAENKLNELKIQHAAELEQAYDNISPTMTYVDYDLGRIYSSSINPEEYAIYLIELQEKHKRKEEYWAIRAEAYKQALSMSGGNKEKLFATLSEIVSKTPELQRKEAVQEEIEDVESYDKQIDKMSDEELFSDYWSLDEHLEQNEKIIDRCLWLRQSQEMSYKDIGKIIGITTNRVKEILQEAN